MNTLLCPAMAFKHDSAKTAAAYAIDSVADPFPACGAVAEWGRVADHSQPPDNRLGSL